MLIKFNTGKLLNQQHVKEKKKGKKEKGIC